ncbi:DNA-dirted DNA polymerase [Pandoraea thiooxydans]|uniref:DNA polymerase III subunit chi n=1 Tax=Pandoraea thiooxydans TaxID=445709 RepID=A0A0G3EP91_9BURK|nr:DNA polymerase III subunit chi [Pandoraea thiooxydans]AKJ67137.1 DNA polymerase III subunit chi [Pandoraea thiooxydans]APR94097.1 DNA-dirted DNA polymerase [Pandoraea thiooxydans]
MTRIDFHIHVADRLGYACRLTRKVVTAGQRLVVVGEAASLREFDQQLWTFSALEFVPHCALDDALAPHTPVLLASTLDDAGTAPHYQVLLNLGGAVPPQFARFERVLEVVGRDPQELADARERYRFYRDRGYTLNNYDQRS